jgi:histidinol-phosphate phosphatase family protein
MSGAPRYDVVIPTTGRATLPVLLHALGAADGPPPQRVLIVDDRPPGAPPLGLDGGVPALLAGRTYVLAAGGRGPAAARNAGWRAADAEWVAFLDDDVIPPGGWRAELTADLACLARDVAGSQGRVRVPLRRDRRPTDWERNVAGLERARWATADLAYRRAALRAVGGFDERFPRAYREDSDLGLRLAARGLRIVQGRRTVLHPVPPGADRWVSLRKQAGNADDALMAALHGRGWRGRAGAPPGRLARHAATTAAGAAAAAAALAGARRTAALAGGAWLAGTAELAWARIAPGPRTRGEVASMAITSVPLPAVATAQRLAGTLRARRARALPGAPVPDPPAVVLLDRDGTLIDDVPYNGDPRRVRPLPGVAVALDRLRARGVRLALVSNQSGIARGLLTPEQVAAVTDRVAELLGPFDDVRWCPHGPGDGCACRKPAPGLLLDAAAALGVDPLRCAMLGDIGADVEAARAAGMRGVLVPRPATLAREIAAAPERAASLGEAVDLLLREPVRREATPVPLRPAARGRDPRPVRAVA